MSFEIANETIPEPLFFNSTCFKCELFQKSKNYKLNTIQKVRSFFQLNVFYKWLKTQRKITNSSVPALIMKADMADEELIPIGFKVEINGQYLPIKSVTGRNGKTVLVTENAEMTIRGRTGKLNLVWNFWVDQKFGGER